MATVENLETVQLLKDYIWLVRGNANKCNPLSRIIQSMRAIESREDD